MADAARRKDACFGCFLNLRCISGCSPVGRVPALGAGGREFKSRHSDQESPARKSGPGFSPSACRNSRPPWHPSPVAAAAARRWGHPPLGHADACAAWPRVQVSPLRRRGLRIVRDGVFFSKATAISHSLPRSSSPNLTRFAGLIFGFYPRTAYRSRPLLFILLLPPFPGYATLSSAGRPGGGTAHVIHKGIS